MYCSALQSPLNAMNVSNGMDRSVKLCSMSVSRVFIHKLFLLIFISLCDDFFKKGKTCMEICIIYQWILLFSQNAELCAHFTQSAHWGGGCIIPKTQVFKTFWYTSFSQELAEVQKPKDTCVPIYTLIQARKCESD